MADFKERIDELAQLMDEFHLGEARLESEGFAVAFRRKAAAKQVLVSSEAASEAAEPIFDHSEAFTEEETVVSGTPVTSPMTGIFYAAPSPGSPPFVKEGDEVTSGQIIGLIEAMKVFNEIPCPVSGVVTKLVAEAGGVVQLGDTLILVTP